MNASELRAVDEEAKKAKYQARLARVIVLVVGMAFAGLVGYSAGKKAGNDEVVVAKATMAVASDVAMRNVELERALTERTTEKLMLLDRVRELEARAPSRIIVVSSPERRHNKRR